MKALSKIQSKKIIDLFLQADMFDMDIDWESLKLIPKDYFKPQPVWLERWKEKNADKQWDHENQNNDGGE